MPELPEVETVRAGLERYLPGRTITAVEVFEARSLRRHRLGAASFRQAVTGNTIAAVVRRGKFIWLPFSTGAALVVHLGMSGQLLMREVPLTPLNIEDNVSAHVSINKSMPKRVDLTAAPASPPTINSTTAAKHLRIRLFLSSCNHALALNLNSADMRMRQSENLVLDFVDQRIFGSMQVSPLIPTADGNPGGKGSPAALIPQAVTHIARDLLDPVLDKSALTARIQSSRRAIKTILLDQSIVSGIGNIYADEGLWSARVHGASPGNSLEASAIARVLAASATVMQAALAQGGTSFDALYVNVEGASGYFARELKVYGKAGQPCPRCATTLQVQVIAGRSHTFCPRCQPGAAALHKR